MPDYVSWLAVRDLIGREREQRRLVALLDRADGGDGGAALVRGEAGIGKTALARWSEVIAGDRGFVTLRGRCHPHGSAVSYGPLVEAFGRVFRTRSPDELEGLTDRIAGLSLLFPGLVTEPELADLPEELALTRTLEAIRGLLVRLAANRTLLLVIDDVQWADDATLRALAHLAGELEVAPVALILTLRDGDAAERPDVRTMLTALRRSCPVDEVAPARLDVTETGRVLATITDEPLAANLVEEIQRRTAGTPLFIESLGREILVRSPGALGEPGIKGSEPIGHDVAPPAAIRDAVAERLHGLDEDSHDVLAAISVASTATDLATVQRVTQLDDTSFSAAVERLLARNLASVDSGPEGAVEASHPLIAEVAEHLLPPPERSRLHARFLAVLGDQADPEVAALHVLGAGERVPTDQALAVLDAAAGQAASRQAYGSTVTHAKRALELVEPLQQPDTELSIRHRLASALLGLGKATEAARVADGALRLQPRDPVALLPAICQAEVAAWLTGEAKVELDRLDGALAALPLDDNRPEVLRAFELRLAAYARRGSRRIAHAEDLISRTASATEPPARAGHLIGLGYRHVLEGQHHLVVPLMEEILALDRGDLPAWLVHRARLILVDCLANTGPVDRFQAKAATIGGDGEGLYVSWRDHLVAYRCGLAQLEPECLDLPDGVPSQLGTQGSVQWPDPVLMAHRAWLLNDRDGLDSVAAELAERRRRFPDRQSVVVDVEVVDNIRVLVDGDRKRARDRLRHRDPSLGEDQLQRESLEVLHRLATLAGQVDEAVGIERTLLRLDGGTGWASAQALFLRGRRLADRDGDGDDPVETVLTDAANRLEAIGDRHRLAECLTVLAEETGTVDDRLSELLDPVEVVGLTALAERIQTVLGPRAAADSSRTSRPALTRRQQEIAELVAEGLSNAAIADRLFISVRTVTSHLDHIYTRLGIGNRTELAVLLPELR